MDTQKTYLIGQVSEITGISAKQLRSWEGKYFPFPPRLVSGHRTMRYYTDMDIEILKRIKHHRDKGFTLPVAAEQAEQTIPEKEDQHEQNNV